METIIGILIPFVGTTIGASMVFFMKDTLNIKIEKLLLGFASGVMIAASIWSLLIPAIEMAEEQAIIPWIPAVIGFLIGIFSLLAIDFFIERLERKENSSNKNKGLKSKLKDLSMLVLSVTLHNIPEGMAVRCGVCRCFVWKFECYYGRSYIISNWNCNTKFPRGRNYFNAT